MVGHIAGVPFEEWLMPFVASGSGLVLGLRAALYRRHHRP